MYNYKQDTINYLSVMSFLQIAICLQLYCFATHQKAHRGIEKLITLDIIDIIFSLMYTYFNPNNIQSVTINFSLS